MPDAPGRKPLIRGRPSQRGRGRGGSASAASAQPAGRLASLRRDDPAPASTSTGGSMGGISGMGGIGGARKLKFTPKIPARRIKREPVTPKLDDAPAMLPVKQEDRKPRRERKRVELIERVTGPFAQGPASLGRVSGRDAAVGGGFSSISGPSFDADVAKTESNGGVYGSPSVFQETDYNQRARENQFEVQTEAMALEAFERMNRLQLDYTASEEFGFVEGATNPKDLELVEDRLMVFQIPKLPEFEMDRATRQELRYARRHAKSAEAMDEDIKPEVPKNGSSEVIDVDVKPDVSKLDQKPNVMEIDDNDDDSGSADGRIGTLVVLRSGAVKLKLGEILYDVSRASEC
ncbi:hypothetical protein H4R23_004363, partial [Coemansia sp. Cherry 401B]